MSIDQLLYRNFCPFSHELKISRTNSGKLPLCAKVQVIAFTAIAALCSFFIFGLLAIPAFKWSVKAFSTEKITPKDEMPVSTPNTTPAEQVDPPTCLH